MNVAIFRGGLWPPKLLVIKTGIQRPLLKESLDLL
jgi:hypothetical protein